MRHFAFAATLLLIAASAAAQPLSSTFTLELDSSRANITATAGGASARFGSAAGALEFNNAKPEESTFALSLDTTSIAEQTTRDAFDSEHFPEMLVSSTSAARKGSGGAEALPTNVTIRGITRPVVFQVTFQKVGTNVIALHAEATLRTADFKLSGKGGNIQLVIDAPFNRVGPSGT